MRIWHGLCKNWKKIIQWAEENQESKNQESKNQESKNQESKNIENKNIENKKSRQLYKIYC